MGLNGIPAGRNGDAGCRDLAALAVLADAQDRRSIRAIFEASGWGVQFAKEADEIRGVLDSGSVPVLIMDDDPGVPSWRHYLNSPCSIDPCARQKLIVVSRLADEHLWAEVLHLGGYELLAKPLDPEQVVRAVGAALAEEPLPVLTAAGA